MCRRDSTVKSEMVMKLSSDTTYIANLICFKTSDKFLCIVDVSGSFTMSSIFVWKALFQMFSNGDIGIEWVQNLHWHFPKT